MLFMNNILKYWKMDEERIIEEMKKTHRCGTQEFSLDYKPREIYETMKKFMHTRQIISLAGLRRTGKTTIMLKIVIDNIRNFKAENILYFSFDYFKEARLDEIVKIYLKLLGKDGRGKYLFLFDEIQKVENWEEQLKRLYDNFPNIKFIISGSESLFIRKNTRESLAGRIYEFQLMPLSFKEYLVFRGRSYDNFLLYKEEILREYKNFICCNGFPEIINENREIAEKYIKENIIEKIIYKDIPQMIPIREPAVLAQILRIMLNDPGEIINYDDLASELKVSRQTISLYTDYLEKAFLIKKIYNFSRNIRKTEKKLKKYYPTIMLPEVMETKEMAGKIFETFIVIQLNAEYFWRDSYKNEVDIIKINKELLPIEVKLKEIAVKSLALFMKKYKLKRGVILTYDKKDKLRLDGREIRVIPFYEYLLG